MILFALACDAGHRFDSWFRGNDAFDEQAAQGLVECPVCGSKRVAKAIMAPAVLGARAVADVPPPPRSGTTEVALLDERGIEARAFLKGLRDAILAKGQDVGDRFPEEARRIHDGASPVRQIHGRATPKEARGLIEDGIMILPIPTLPEELN
jgi:hypothetical protein